MQYTYALTLLILFCHFGCCPSLLSTKVSCPCSAVAPARLRCRDAGLYTCYLILVPDRHILRNRVFFLLNIFQFLFFRSQLSLKQVQLLHRTEAFQSEPGLAEFMFDPGLRDGDWKLLCAVTEVELKAP